MIVASTNGAMDPWPKEGIAEIDDVLTRDLGLHVSCLP